MMNETEVLVISFIVGVVLLVAIISGASLIEYSIRNRGKIFIGSRWASDRYEITDIKLEYPETDSTIKTNKDKVTIVYVREINNGHIRKYEISEFKKWFRK